MKDKPIKKKDLRAADQDAALEGTFAAGKWIEEDRRKSVEPSPIQQPPVNQILPTQGRIIPPMPPRMPLALKRQVDHTQRNIALTVIGAMALCLLIFGVCR